MYKIETYIPKENLKTMQDALLEIDAGHIGNYKGCMTIYEVIGRWYSDEGANPTIGKVGQWSEELELKLEFNVNDDKLDETIRVIKNTHPYEEPVINIIKLL